MNEIVIATIVTVSAVGIVAAIILYWASQKFKVFEDPRIADVEAVLPAANCGGCGYPGCRNFAEACVKADNLDKLNCPVGGNETMALVGKALGKEATARDRMIAVVRCSGTPEFRNRTNIYDGASNCTIASKLYAGDTDCAWGCLGMGDCVDVCNFDAIHINPLTLLPEVSQEKCTACNSCVVACPKDIIELRPAGKKNMRIFVSCINQDKGGDAKKACSVACIGCTKCQKVCPHEAITIQNFLAYIDPIACKLCRKCVTECPTNAIWEVNFPPRKLKPAAEPAEKSEVNLVDMAKNNADKKEE